MGRITGIVGFGITLLLFLSVLSAYIKPSEYDILVLFALVFPYLYLAAWAVLPFLWKKNRFNFILLGLLLLFSTRGFMQYVQLPGSSQAASSDLHVLTTNAMMGVKLVDDKHLFGEDRQAVFNELMHREPVPDIICAQEANHIIDQALRGAFGYKYYHKLKKRGSAILSKYPIVKEGLIDFGAKLNSCLWADIKVGADTVRIYSVHLESNRLTQETHEFLASEGYDNIGAINGIRDLFSKYPKYARARADQATMIAEHIAKCRHPIILAGDFNEPPMSYTYRLLRRTLQDAFVNHGSGWGTTWIGTIPLLRIDYILYSPDLTNTHYQCLKTDLTDHYPVKASFGINEK